MAVVLQLSPEIRQLFFAGHIPQVTITGHSIFARNRTRLALKYIFSKNIFCLGAQFSRPVTVTCGM